MLRLTRPLFQVLKKSTGITGLAVHPNPLPELSQTYQSTLSLLSTLPPTSVYRQSVEALTKHKLNIVQSANGDIGAVETQLDEGQIEESIDIANDEKSLVEKMLEWKGWEPLEEKPDEGQWDYFGKTTTPSSLP
ncbi:Ndufa5, NADH-ubiquinone oxidoreductase subunit [Serpula lacrymans var. lacrymans S7.3]|uniref:Ndufa5, NADH-ubiquinone oxidoreductase subunit n=2 Tax=Serpula lacrymans var. lacrymans TaxID=341189 RepID=F8QGV4_SERL3|nr:NDUFA5, NADH-ubiquinone oxidoreductase subunit [Serpula lacrymans var. lacrymans S7.9]EGN92436.1 Ndufa5, NADH-ubiquinone oxidoreductase subunit [Serpula lacrymans var. lacrymans S7.3]EGO18562.1 NDUFA5, NADH-ubiquinone oxidoreductase subunit [Serpula lacrymans var. lacrymans S7.9]